MEPRKRWRAAFGRWAGGCGMREYTEVERSFPDQLAAQGWTVIDQGGGVRQVAALSLRGHSREWQLPTVFDEAVRAINRTDDGREWLTPRHPGTISGFLLHGVKTSSGSTTSQVSQRHRA